MKKLEAEGILRPIEHATWAAPIVTVVKPDRSIRICGDFKQTVNRAARLDTYPIPKVKEILSKLSQGKHFTKLDHSQAYNQVRLSAESQKNTAINTQRGLFQITRLPFGISSASSIFQRVFSEEFQALTTTWTTFSS